MSDPRPGIKLEGPGSLFAMMLAVGLLALGLGLMGAMSPRPKPDKVTNANLQGKALAESGIQLLYDQIAEQMTQEAKYPLALKPLTVTTPINGKDVLLGSYAAKVESVNTTEKVEDLGGRLVLTKNLKFTLAGEGDPVNGDARKVVAKFDASFAQTLEPIPADMGVRTEDVFLPPGAVVSNGPIQIQSEVGLRTIGTNAHLLSNQGLVWNPKGVAKEKIANPRVIDVQGRILVPQGSVYDQTISAQGIGNPTGAKNYTSPASAAQENLTAIEANTVGAMARPVGFAASLTVQKWSIKAKNRVNRSDTNNYRKSLKSSDLPAEPPSGERRLTGPTRIAGDLTVDPGTKLRLTPGFSNAADNVVYVDGWLINKGEIINEGVTLVVNGKVLLTAGSNYRVDETRSPFKTRAEVLARARLLCLSEAPDAVAIASGKDSQIGLIYAANGGITQAGKGCELTGILAAGGPSGISFAPTDRAMVIRYEPGAGLGAELPTPVTYLGKLYQPNGIWKPFKAQPWVAPK